MWYSCINIRQNRKEGKKVGQHIMIKVMNHQKNMTIINLFIPNNRAKIKLQGKLTNPSHLEFSDNKIIVCQNSWYIAKGIDA